MIIRSHWFILIKKIAVRCIGLDVSQECRNRMCQDWKPTMAFPIPSSLKLLDFIQPQVMKPTQFAMERVGKSLAPLWWLHMSYLLEDQRVFTWIYVGYCATETKLDLRARFGLHAFFCTSEAICQYILCTKFFCLARAQQKKYFYWLKNSYLYILYELKQQYILYVYILIEHLYYFKKEILICTKKIVMVYIYEKQINFLST